MARCLSYVLFCLVITAEWLGWTDGRSIPAKNDLCARLPNSHLCQQDAPEDDLPSTPKPIKIKPPKQGGPYCDVNAKQYYKYCWGDQHAEKRQRAVQFCQNYESACFISTVFPSAEEVLNGGSTANPLDNIPVRKDGHQTGLRAYPNQPGQSLGSAGALGSSLGVDQLAVSNPAMGGGLSSSLGANQLSATNPAMGLQQGMAPVNPAMTSGGSGGTGSQGFNYQQPLGFLGGTTGNMSPAYGPFGQSGQGQGAPLTIGGGVSAPYFSGMRGTAINPLSSVQTGWGLNAAGMPIGATSGVNFGGLIPGGLSNMFG